MSTQETLDRMAADIVERKQAPTPRRQPANLTPTAGEVAAAPPVDADLGKASVDADLRRIMPKNPTLQPVTADDLGNVLDMFKTADRARSNAERALTGLYWRLKGEPVPPLDEAEHIPQLPRSTTEPVPQAVEPAPVAEQRWACPKHDVLGELRTGASGKTYTACPFPGCKKQAAG